MVLWLQGHWASSCKRKTVSREMLPGCHELVRGGSLSTELAAKVSEAGSFRDQEMRLAALRSRF